MRYDVKKFLFVGVEADRDAFFKRAQDAGIIHFVSPVPIKTEEAPAVQELLGAIKVLRGLPTRPQEDLDSFDYAQELAEKILSLKDTLTDLQEEQRVIDLDISRVEVFGDFSMDDIAYIEREGKRKLQFYCAKQGFADHPDLPAELIYTGSNHGLDYFVGINRSAAQYPKMVEMLIDRPLGTLKKRLSEVHGEIVRIEGQLKECARYNAFLHQALVQQLDHYHLTQAKTGVAFPIDQQSLFVVEGWVPVHKIDALQPLVTEMKVHVEEISLDDKDVPPTCLENTGLARIGEDLVHVYDTPSHTDKDPSLWVLFFFTLFFSMIINDAGYGLILLAVALYVRYKYTALRGVKKRMLDLFTILSVGIIAWGVLTTSFFGLELAPDNPWQKVSVMNWLVEKKTAYHMQRQDEVYKEWTVKYPAAKEAATPTDMLMKAAGKHADGKFHYDMLNKFTDSVLLELALFVGVIHIILSMALNLRRNWASAGWIIFLVGAYLYTPSLLGDSSLVNFAFGVDQQAVAKDALYMMYGGMGLAVGLALIQHRLAGLHEIANLIQIFGDVLSYLRLYALGLAGALLAATMTELASGVPFVFGVLIQVFGHTVNIILGIMGGVIHGLRLNFLEWYHYCFEGGGKVFNPLKKLDVE